MDKDNAAKNKITLGILAHVDAGKTTLAEALLYSCGIVKTPGRVDKGNAFLDTFELEKKRGITIFSKQAVFEYNNVTYTLLDTPGHADFASEAERTLSVLDYAVLVISGTDGVQSHTVTLFHLLEEYKVPVIVFVNKMDIAERSEQSLLDELGDRTGYAFGNFSTPSDEDIASLSEALMEEYLSGGKMSPETIKKEVRARHIIPVFFGSALKLTGVEQFLDGLSYLTVPFDGDPSAPVTARVIKITHDPDGTRLTHLKLLSGTVSVRDTLNGEKVDRIRIYSGGSFKTTESVGPGTIVAICGLSSTYAGELIGSTEKASDIVPRLFPAMSYSLILPDGADIHKVFQGLKNLSEELPETGFEYIEETNEIKAGIMGSIQTEILKSLILERLGLDVSFGPGNIIYRETVTSVSEGVGHFEPLRHYAEAHVKIEPNERGRGIEIFSDVSTDDLELNFQRLIMTHLAERRHKGVLTGSELTDVKLTVVGGRSHPKHTEGGDFRQATYRAVRQGLMYNTSVLLEPYYDFMLEVPAAQLGRAMNDITRLEGTVKTHSLTQERAVIYGRAPVSTMHEYAFEVTAYTRGEGKLSLSPGGYDVCHNADEVIAEKAYDPASDLRNTPDSVFCAHGAGFVVPWNEVYNYMHVPLKTSPGHMSSGNALQADTFGNPMSADAFGPSISSESAKDTPQSTNSRSSGGSYTGSALDGELAEIFNRTYGSGTSKKGGNLFSPLPEVRHEAPREHVEIKPRDTVPEYLLVDGYNIIFAWDDLNDLAKTNLDGARHRLMDILSNYRGFKDITLILVFDAYKVKGGVEKIEEYHNIHVVYTKEAETADSYIEKTAGALAKKGHVTVATSDSAEQVIIFGTGALRMSARELRDEIAVASKSISEIISEKTPTTRNPLIDSLPRETAEKLESKRFTQK
ncbi:MAG: TetM/TetW/TetO/TetS family tetracycline resistance ribosomal protection protein [Lachnospiraceae bacterium]|nr:TetM/TetW/TetO/TetS family tetracycline resistance ribosomal protection protein [Lachnospiraceae bacterium]